ncbi:hypothetical protein R5R35_009982 [Gryllus longicercus]|uniref:Uncharacterized protein n=1 Tax=Gryllus longicercus TaxID=2509291 RepID=A0AAN9Z631_9ORTH
MNFIERDLNYARFQWKRFRCVAVRDALCACPALAGGRPIMTVRRQPRWRRHTGNRFREHTESRLPEFVVLRSSEAGLRCDTGRGNAVGTSVSRGSWRSSSHGTAGDVGFSIQTSSSYSSVTH